MRTGALPCPRCGFVPRIKMAILKEDGIRTEYGYRCVCCGCGRAAIAYESTASRAVRAWNKGIETIEKMIERKRVME